jgi:hypothetical protein
MNWICLFAVETADQRWLFYGCSTRAAGLQTGDWFEKELGADHGRWRLLRYTRIADDQALASLRTGFSSGPKTVLPLRKGRHLEINHGPLLSRPEVYAVPRVIDSSGTPVSLSDQLAMIGASWQVAPDAFIDAAFPPTSFLMSQRQEAMFRVLDLMRQDTGIDFLGRDAGRLGNFEVIRYLAGSYDILDGLQCRPEMTTPAADGAAEERALLVWIEPPLADRGQLRVGCRLFNGHSGAYRTLLIDEIRLWPTADGAPLRFCPVEPFSSSELSVWGEDGRLLARQEQSVLRGVDLELRIANVTRMVSTPWDEKLPLHLRRIVAEATAWSRTNARLGDYQGDPWVVAADRKRTLIQGLGAGGATDTSSALRRTTMSAPSYSLHDSWSVPAYAGR